MFKKIALAAALITSAAFATWDYYPVLEAGKGSAEAGMYYDWYHKWSQAGIKVGGRYSLIQGLEVSLQGWGYQLWSEEDCDGCANGGDGLRDLTLGVRYEIAPMITVFLDFNLPIGGDEVTNDEIALYGGAQFSMPINEVPGLKFGTEAGVFWGFAHGDNDYERGLEIHLGGELAYTVPNVGVTPLVGIQLKYRITESTWEEYDGGKKKKVERGDDSDGDNQFILWLGAGYFVIPNQLELKAKLFVRSGDHAEMGGDASGIYVGAEFFF